MELNHELLREIHRILRQRTDLNERISRGPKRLKGAASKLQESNERLEQSEVTQKKTRLLSNERQLQLSSREQKVVDLKTKLNTCETTREYKMLSDQIAADEEANNVLADEIFELLERIDEEAEQHIVITEEHAQAVEEHDAVVAKVNEETDQLKSELERVLENLTDAIKRLPVDFRADFKRIEASKGEETLGKVDDECCGNCYQTLSPQIFNNLYLNKPVFCPSCGCLLYLPEGFTKIK